MSAPCPFCGGSMAGRHKNAKFCSDKHRRRYFEHGENGREQCVDCGVLMGVGSKGKHDRCRPCHAVRVGKPVTERGKQIERWWAEGLSMVEIASRLGWAKGTLSNQIDRLRAKGFDLPYRYRKGIKNGSKFAHLRKAA